MGRNNLQNDRLTTKQAGKWDYWFHTQKIHGAHVILWTEGRQPDDQSLREAAALAAWFSQGREGKKVPVDYTPGEIREETPPAPGRGMGGLHHLSDRLCGPGPRLGGHAACREEANRMASFVCYRFQCPRYPDCAPGRGKGLLHRAGPGPAGGPGGACTKEKEYPYFRPARRILSMPGCAGSEKSVCISRADLPHTERRGGPLGAAIRERRFREEGEIPDDLF